VTEALRACARAAPSQCDGAIETLHAPAGDRYGGAIRALEIAKTSSFPLADREIGVLVVLASKPLRWPSQTPPERLYAQARAKDCSDHRGRSTSAGGFEMSAKRLTKAQVITEIAESSELDRKSVGRVFDSLTELIKKELRKPNGEFVIPGLLKLRAIKKPATKDRPGINPFTKQPITIKGKPAQKKVKATALKALKDLIQ
jgi:nucleoid DNA-binding protein